MSKRHALSALSAGFVLLVLGVAALLVRPTYVQLASAGPSHLAAVLAPLPPTDTPARPTPTPTGSPPTGTATATPCAGCPTATPTPTLTPTYTPTVCVHCPTFTPTSPPTGTPPTATPTVTGTPPTATPTFSPSRTPSLTPTRPTATPAPAGCWSLVPSPNPAAYHGLYALAAVAANDVWAAGTYFNNGYRALIEHWDGSAWTVVPVPDPGNNDQLYGVAAVSSNDVWAVGKTDYSSYSPPLIEHWNGSAWSVVPAPGEGALQAVAALASNDVWAVGYSPGGNSSSLIVHWDGSAWHQVPSPNPGQDNFLWSISAAGPADIWAAGDLTSSGMGRTLTVHWDGFTWQTIPSANFDNYSNVLHSVTVAGPNDVWAVGESVVNGALIEHWTGGAWTIVPGPNLGGYGQLFGVTALAWDDIWALGRYPNGANTEQTLVEHWNGSGWVVVPGPYAGTWSELEAVAAAGPLDVWAVGGPESPIIEHYSPFCPTPTATPVPPTLTPTVTGTLPTLTPPPTATHGPCPFPPCVTSTPRPSSTSPAVQTRTSTLTATLPPPSATRPPATNTPSGTNTPVPTPTRCAASFGDVQPPDYFYQPVLYLACNGIVSGYADGTFRPYNQTTRAQTVKIVVLGFGLAAVSPAAGQYTFADVLPTSPFFAQVETAAGHQVVTGYNCGALGEPCDALSRPYFRPAAYVTRGQLSKVVVVAAGWPLVDPPAATFADVLPGSAFYQTVETAACHSIVGGYACGAPGEPCDTLRRAYFRQYNPATRGQIAKIVYISLTAGGGCGPTAPVRGSMNPDTTSVRTNYVK